MLSVAVVALGALALAPQSSESVPPALLPTEILAPAPDDASLARWVEHLQPRPEEVAWERIGWRAAFADGLRAADAEGRPLLLWAMNGHPLGCT